jgi:hypothetical protein
VSHVELCVQGHFRNVFANVMANKFLHKFHSNSSWVEGLKVFGMSLFLAFGIRSFVAEARYIPSGVVP